MARRQAPSAPVTNQIAASGGDNPIIPALEQLSEDINGLRDIVEEGTLLKSLVGEIVTLRSAIDDVRAEIEWASRNLMQSRPLEQPQRVTSMPVDPCDPEWGTKLNRLSAQDLPSDNTEATSPLAEEAGVESPVYCCETPRLTWQDDPEAPSVICQACGYVVAEYGNVVDHREERPDAFHPPQTQGRLWDDAGA